jgi:hypothetical protein
MAVLNRLLVLLLGVAVLALGALLIAETVAELANQQLLVDHQQVGSTMRELTWAAPDLLPVWVVLIAVGALLLILQLVPRTPAWLPLPSTGEGHSADVSRRSVGSLLTDVARDADGVRSARATVTPRAARVDVVARPGADVEAVRGQVEQAVSERLAALRLGEQVTPRVSVARSRERE